MARGDTIQAAALRLRISRVHSQMSQGVSVHFLRRGSFESGNARVPSSWGACLARALAAFPIPERRREPSVAKRLTPASMWFLTRWAVLVQALRVLHRWFSHNRLVIRTVLEAEVAAFLTQLAIGYYYAKVPAATVALGSQPLITTRVGSFISLERT